MRRFICISLLLILFGVQPAAALDCDMPSPSQALAQADLVLIGEVVSEPLFMGAPERKPHTIRVERVFKGEAEPRVTLLHSPNIGPDIRLEKGQRYLLFTRWRPQGGFVTSSCMATRQLTGELPPEFAAVLGPGYAPDGLPQRPVPAWMIWAGGAVLLGAGVLLLRTLAPIRRKG